MDKLSQPHNPEENYDLRYQQGWQELLSAPDAHDYQTWLADLVKLSHNKLSGQFDSKELNEAALSYAWKKVIEDIAQVAIVSEDLNNLNESEIIETALLTMQANIDSLGWDEEGLSFLIPNITSGEFYIADVRQYVS